VPPAAIRASCCATLLVQATVAAGLSLLDAALLLCRPDDDAPSELERLIAQAERLTAHALSKPRLPEERRVRHASYEQAYALSNPRLRSHADGANYSPDLKQPKQRQAVGFGARPDRSLSAEDLSSLDARGSAPASPRGGALPAACSPSMGLAAGSRAGGAEPRQQAWGADSPEEAGRGLAGARDSTAAMDEGRPPTRRSSLPTLLHRVSSERAIGSATASSPSASCGATGGTGPAAAGACGGASSLLDGHIAFDGSAAEETFYEYYGRLLDEAVRRAVRRVAVSGGAAQDGAAAGGGEREAAAGGRRAAAAPGPAGGGESTGFCTVGEPPRRMSENNLARLVPRSSRSSIKEDEEDSS